MGINSAFSLWMKILVLAALAYQCLSTNIFCQVVNCVFCQAFQNQKCILCDIGYSLTQGQRCCHNSVQNCQTCIADSSQCDQCVSDSYCLQGRTCQTCSSHLSHCSTCSDCQTCTSCQSNLYVVNASSLCQLCSQLMDYCYNCTNSNTCIQCVNNSFAVNSTSNQCQTCSSLLLNCLTCSSENTCLSCVNNSFAVNSTSQQCQLCSTLLVNCTRCVNEFTCIACQVDPAITLKGGRCLSCGSSIPKCLSCSRNNYCSICSDYYAVVPSGDKASCTSCSDLMAGCLNCSSQTNCTTCSIGSVVDYGCSPVPGCASVTLSFPASVCTSCRQPQFRPGLVNGSCVCASGHLAGMYCTHIIGCTNILRNSSGDFCISCNIALNFQLRNYDCMCKQYYELKGSLCQQVCGDGILISLQCDDGNLIDGDGCSSSCQIEKGYNCSQVNSHQKSVCTYKGKMTMSLSCINNLGKNTANIVFAISPPISNFAKSNLTGLITFNSANNCTMTNYQIIGSFLYVFIKFEEDIEGKWANVTLRYDPYYITSPSSQKSFQLVQCNDNQLLYEPPYSEASKNFITASVKIISILAWAAWLAGSYSHKMIGVEALNTIQLIFIMQAFAPRYSPVVAYFSELNSVLNGFQRLLSSKLVDKSSTWFYRLSYGQSVYSNLSVAFILLFTSVLTLLILQFISRNCFPDSYSGSKRNPLLKRMSNLRRQLYNILIFPSAMGFFFNFMFGILIPSQRQCLRLLMISFLMVSIGFVFFNQWKELLIRQDHEWSSSFSFKSKYVSVYLNSIFLISIVACASICSILPNPMSFLAGLQIFNAILMLVYRPYDNCVHSSGLIINQSGIVINAGWIFCQEYVYLDRSMDEKFALAVVGWMFLIIVWSFIRTLFQLWRKKKKFEWRRERKKAVKQKEKRKSQIEDILEKDQSQVNKYFARQRLLQQHSQEMEGGLFKKQAETACEMTVTDTTEIVKKTVFYYIEKEILSKSRIPQLKQ